MSAVADTIGWLVSGWARRLVRGCAHWTSAVPSRHRGRVTSRTLILMRHAKSDWPVGVPDHDRPLNDRGLRDAAEAGRVLAALVGRVDAVAVSTARRTQMTWELVSGSLEHGRRSDEERIYAASPRVLLDVVNDLPDDAEIGMLVGHNPGTEILAEALAGTAEDVAMSAMNWKFPTAGIAILTFDGAWHSLAPGGAHLREFIIPRG